MNYTKNFSTQGPGYIPRHLVQPVPEDLVGIVTFGDIAKVLCPPVGVTAPELLTCLEDIEAGGCTNMTDGMQAGLNLIKDIPRSFIKRFTFFADGRPNVKEDALMPLVPFARAAYVSVDGVYCSADQDGKVLLQSMCDQTVGGRFYEVDTVQAMTDAVISRPAPRLHRRAGCTIIMIDVSGSMNTPMRDGTTRLQAAIKASQQLILTKRWMFGAVRAEVVTAPVQRQTPARAYQPSYR